MIQQETWEKALQGGGRRAGGGRRCSPARAVGGRGPPPGAICVMGMTRPGRLSRGDRPALARRGGNFPGADAAEARPRRGQKRWPGTDPHHPSSFRLSDCLSPAGPRPPSDSTRARDAHAMNCAPQCAEQDHGAVRSLGVFKARASFSPSRHLPVGSAWTGLNHSRPPVD